MRPSRRRRLLTIVLSVAAHGLVLLALISARPGLSPPPEPEPMSLQLVTLPPPPPPPPPEEVVEPPAPAPPAPVRPPRPRRIRVRTPKPAPPNVAPLQVAKGPTTQGEAVVSEAQLGAAGSAESGSGGGACNMIRRVQNALRKDPLARAAVASAGQGRAIMVWNGDWIRHADQDGAGLAAVREAIMWEVGFAPAVCRAEAVHGLIRISLNDGPGSTQLVVGGGDWRWSDLLARGRSWQ